MLVHHQVAPPSPVLNLPVPIYTPGCREIHCELRVMYLATSQNTTHYDPGQNFNLDHYMWRQVQQPEATKVPTPLESRGRSRGRVQGVYTLPPEMKPYSLYFL